MEVIQKIVVTGGGGYVGAVLVPKLLEKKFDVTVLDLFIYGEEVFEENKNLKRLKVVKGDIRDRALLERELEGMDAVIHLACISNDPSFELDPVLGKAINYDATKLLVDVAKQKKVKRFVYASSSSVYGVKNEPNVTEDLPLEPLTDYSKYKALSEEYILKAQGPDFTCLVLRPATVAGYSPRQRFDLTVNMLTNQAINTGTIKVFGGDQQRPNIHIEDMTDLYVRTMMYPKELIAGKIFNAGYENHTVYEIAQIVKRSVGDARVKIIKELSDDNRSYRISSDKIKQDLGFAPHCSIEDAVFDLKKAFAAGRLPNSLTDPRYSNIKMMKAINLK